MSFGLWDSGFGGALINSFGPVPLLVSKGLFEAELPFGVGDFGGADRYLELTVNGEVLTPRIKLVSALFSLRAEETSTASTADTAGLALQVAPGSVGTQGLASGAVTADKLGIPCNQGEILVKGTSGWMCSTPTASTLCLQGNGIVDDGLGSTTCGLRTCARTVSNCFNGTPQTCTPLPDGTPCDDGAFCTVNDLCGGGACAGAPRNCADSLQCSTDSCNEVIDACEHACIGAAQFCVSSSTQVTCTGSGPTCGEVDTACTFGCNATRSECNQCDPADANACSASTAVVCDTTPPGEGTIESTTVCGYGCESTVPSDFCFFPDTCANPYLINGIDFGPKTFTDDMSHFGADVTGSCGAAGDDVIHRVYIPLSGGFSAFSTIVLDSTASSGIDTASHITTACGDPNGELQYASSVCGAATGSGKTCANTAGTGEVLRACGMPSGFYFATLDSTAVTGAFTLTITVDNVNLDICSQAGNVSNLPLQPTTFVNTTTGKANNYLFDLVSGVLGSCPIGQRNACGEPSGAPGGNLALCGSDGGSTSEDIVFYYRAASSGFLTVDTQGSNFDTILYIKNGCNANCAAPSDCLRCNDDDNFSTGESWSKIYRFPVGAGTLYFIIVDGYGGDDGTVDLHVSFSAI